MKVHIYCSGDETELVKSFAVHFFDENFRCGCEFGCGEGTYITVTADIICRTAEAVLVCVPPLSRTDRALLPTEYAVRPICYDGFRRAMMRLIDGCRLPQVPLVFGEGTPLYIMPSDIVYCDTDRHHVRLHTTDGFVPSRECRSVCRSRPNDTSGLCDDRVIRLRMTFGNAAEVLGNDSRFAVIRYGAAVNMQYVVSISDKLVRLENGAEQEASKLRAAMLKEALSAFRLGILKTK